jgi:phage-related protein
VADDFKPMPEVGTDVSEIIVNTADGWFRVMYVAKFEEALYVLHSFQKKTNKTSQGDKDIAKRRYGAILLERKAK